MTSSKLEIAPPLPLFDPTRGELPPLDAIEVYLEPPPSLSLLHVRCVTTGQHPELLPHFEAAWAAGQAVTMDTLLRNLPIKVGRHQERPGMGSVGSYLFGKLVITHVPHLCVTGAEPYAQMHDHFYIGATAVPDEPRCMSMAGTSLLSPSHVGKQWPVDLFSLREQVASILYALYEHAIQRELTRRIGTRWLPGEGKGPVVAAECQDLVKTFPRLMCPGLRRARPHPPRTRAELLAEALAAEPHASAERRWELRMTIESAPHPDRAGERFVIRDIIDPPRRDLDDDLY